MDEMVVENGVRVLGSKKDDQRKKLKLSTEKMRRQKGAKSISWKGKKLKKTKIDEGKIQTNLFNYLIWGERNSHGIKENLLKHQK